MRTTLTIDDDVMAAAKALAAQQKLSVGEVLSSLARQSLARQNENRVRNGVPLLVTQQPSVPVTPEFIHQLREELE